MIDKSSEVVVIPEGWISSQEAAQITGYTVRYLCQLARQGRVRAIKLGRDWLFNKDSLVGWGSKMEEMGTKKHSPRPKKIEGT